MSEWIMERLQRHTSLPVRFVLLGVAERPAEKWLEKESWWRLWRAWTLHQLWVAWTASTFGSKTYPRLEGIAQQA